MTVLMRNRMVFGLMLVIAAALGAGLNHWFLGGPSAEQDASQNGPRRLMAPESTVPLYWVAPMDPNYRRDQPGRSPMGMALVPVYEDAVETSSGLALVRISPEVINQLGVRTAPVSRRQLQTDLVTTGFVQYDETKIAHIHPRVSGWVEKLYVTAAGDPVEADMPLYTLYAPELVNAQEELIIALKRANPGLISAAEARLQALQVPDSVIQSLKETLSVRQAVAFYAAQSGIVDTLNIREGFFVDPAMTLMSIGQLESVWVGVDIPEQQAALVKTGDGITMTLDYFPGAVWQGRVDFIYPTLDRETRSLRARVVLDNRDLKLKPNMFARVVIHQRSEAARIVIPRDALIRTGQADRAVLALGGGRFQSVMVTVGQVDDLGAEILSGLNLGDQVVTHAQFLIDSESNKGAGFARMNGASSESLSKPKTDLGARHGDHLMSPSISESTNSGPAKQNEQEAIEDLKSLDEAGQTDHNRTGLQAPHAVHALHQRRGAHDSPAGPQSFEPNHHSSEKDATPAHPEHNALKAPSGDAEATQDASEQNHSAQFTPAVPAALTIKWLLVGADHLGQTSFARRRTDLRS
jgi:Cu(I)/Ag(I) efflux system membrane fusion protein